MIREIVDNASGVTLVGGGALRQADLRAALEHAPGVVAADGGLGAVLRAGLSPLAVIGDFDSVAPEALQQVPPDRRHRIADQDTTDFDKALRSIRAPLVIGVGFLGKRLDHQMAAMNVLSARPGRRCILVGPGGVVFALPPEIRLDLPSGSLLSLFPMAPVTGRSQGLRWPIDGISFAPSGLVGTSNEVAGPVRLWMDGPGMLAMLPRRALRSAVRALAGLPVPWPDR